MATYTPGLKVVGQIRHKVRRILPIAGNVLVKAGDRVDAEQVVAETFMPGDVTPINLSNVLSITASEVKGSLLKAEGERVEPGEVLARTKGIFGLFKNEYRTKVGGTIESASAVTGQVILRGTPIPVQVRAYLSGTVVEVLPNEGVVVEADVSLIQGIFGVGGEAYGPLALACREPSERLDAGQITAEHKGKIVIGGGRMTVAAVHQAVKVGAAALVSGGIDDQDLQGDPWLRPGRGGHRLGKDRPDPDRDRRLRRDRDGRADVSPAGLAERRAGGRQRGHANSGGRAATGNCHSDSACRGGCGPR